MEWTYQEALVDEMPEGVIGFVYLITNLQNNKKYIGKKLAQFKKTRPPLKGKKRKRRSTVESDWRTYWGSSDNLNNDVAEFGKENFTREILYYCTARSELSYMELIEQVNRGVLETDEYYNGIINVRIGASETLKKGLSEQRKSGNLL